MSNFRLKCTQNEEYDEYGRLGEDENEDQKQWNDEYRKTIFKYRERLVNELSTEDMIKILFTRFIQAQDGEKTIELGKRYLK